MARLRIEAQIPPALPDYNSVMATDRFGATGSSGRVRALQRIEYMTNSHGISIEVAVLFRRMIRQPPDLSNSEPENGPTEVLGAAVRRRPGRPKGLPKPPGSGRQPGTPNRVGKEARDLAGKYTTKAFKRLAEMLDSKDDKAAAIACREILDRAYGRPVSPQEITGANGTPLMPIPELSNMERAKKLLFMISKSKAEAGRTDRADIEALELRVGIARPAKARTIDVTPPDPFATQRAAQAAEIAATVPDLEPVTDHHAAAVAAQRAERDLARAEGRLEKPAPVWGDPSDRPRRGEDYSPTTATVTRLRPR